MITLAAALVAGLLGGCAGSSENAVGVTHDITPLPKNYKAIVTDYLRTRNRAITKVGNAYQDTCQVGVNDKYYGWAVPVSYQTKKGGRAEASQEIVWINYNSVQMISDNKTGNCVKA
jgi:hypothetical protein